ncbi:Pkinase-domain-containing protein [Xylariaceae sp. FL1651]|nr:Pkinase-domain-containing protein [Xylariaceae sp. FL1651]
MKHIHGGGQDLGADTTHLHDDDQQQQQQQQQQHQQYQRGRLPARSKLSLPLPIPKNRSTGNLAVVAENESDTDDPTPRFRFSFDAGAATGESGSVTSRSTSVIAEHDHGLGLSGLRRIRQHPSPRNPNLSSTAASSRSPSTSIARSASLNMLLPPGPLASVPSSPTFAEDLTRFPSESLHSFSFAHQSEDFIHSRQNVLKRSIEFMKDRMGWAVSSNAAIASAQARVAGDVETQNMLDLLARAQLVGAGNLPNVDPALVAGPLSGPAHVSGENIFDQQFIPRSRSPDSYGTPMISPATVRPPEALPVKPSSAKTQPDERRKSSSDHLEVQLDQTDSENSSRTPTNESGSTAKTSPPVTRRPSLRRTFTDVASAGIQQKLMDAMAQPFIAGQSSGYPDALLSPTMPSQPFASLAQSGALGPAVHGHSSRWVPAAQAIFTTESKPPWTIIAANDLACLVFGVTKAEVRSMGILEVVQEERRAWLENKLLQADSDSGSQVTTGVAPTPPTPPVGSALLGGRGGITAHLLSKPNSRSQPPKVPTRRAQTIHNSNPSAPKTRGHTSYHRSRGVLLCGDVVPIQKRNGATGSASLWVKEKKIGLIWVLEEIHEDVAFLSLDGDGIVTKIVGNTLPLWGQENLRPGMDVGKLITRIPRQGIDPRFGAIDYAQIAKRKYFTCRNGGNINIPATVVQTRGQMELRVSCFPHIAGIIVVSTDTLKIKSSNSAFCGALFGHEKPEGQSINELLLDFDKILEVLQQQDGVQIRDGIVIPEHSFRKASALVGIHEGRPDAASTFLNPDGLLAKHRDGTELKIDVQMRVVKSEKHSGHDSGTSDDESSADETAVSGVESEMVYALWITYSRHLHASRTLHLPGSPLLSGAVTPPHQPSPGQTTVNTPIAITSDSEDSRPRSPPFKASALSRQIKDVAISAAKKLTGISESTEKEIYMPILDVVAPEKKSIEDFMILEDMGQGAYGQVKLARYKHSGGKKVVLKYVTKRRILVDTWTRDRRLGTVPLEIHVLDYLRRDGYKHPNIVEMEDFFEDETNYYIEMAPHGLPGMDLFDYIELRANMDEDECRSIFVQVARAIHHLHTKAKVVHRDIKDENVILDGEGNIKLIDFGSAAYIKSGPFDVFVGTIDYAAPEVLAGKPYGGKEQDVWALGILLYTIIYKENPFYSIDEIMDRDLRVPYTISDESIDLIRCMLNRDVSQRYDIDQVLQHPWCQME